MSKTKLGLGILIGLIVFAVLAGQVGAIFPSGFDKVSRLEELRGYKSFIEYDSNYFNADRATGTFIQDEIIVSFRGDDKPFRVIKVSAGRVSEKVREYRQRGDVIYAEPNYIAYTQWQPNDTYYSYQWHFDNPDYGGIQMEAAWDFLGGPGTPGQGIIVAIVDTGIRVGTDLANTCFVPGYNFVNNSSNAVDNNGHGTHVAGTVAQSTNNSLGVAGVAFNSCLMPVKVLDSRGSGTYADVALGIRYAADNGASVINLSLGGTASDNTLRDAVAYAYEKGATVVAACGNENKPNCLYPAAYDDYVIAVGATQYDESKAPYSSYGSSLDLFAPGGNTSLDQNNDGYGDGVLQQTFQMTGRRITWGYYFFQGTSMAAPHVSGVAALILANGNAVTLDEVRAALQETADYKEGRDDIYGGYGLVNAYAALQWTVEPIIACLSDADCDDNVSCTTNSCIDGACVYTPEDTKCPDDGWVDTGETQWVSVSTDQCTEKEQKEQEYRDYYCHSTLDCQYNITDIRWVDTGAERNKENGTSCEDGLFCTIDDVCQDGQCVSGTARNCEDGNECTTDFCDEDNKTCINTPITECINDDGCCPVGCDHTNDNDCLEVQPVICWSGNYQYLYRNNGQAKKFCKCAQGTYGYNSYSYTWSRKTVYYYVDSGDNENWEIASRSSYLPIYQVTCTNGIVYPTDQDYWYPK